MKISDLPSFIIIKIIDFTDEADKCIFIFNKGRIREGIQVILKTELFKWKYLIKKYDYEVYINKCLSSKNVDVILFRLKHLKKK